MYYDLVILGLLQTLGHGRRHSSLVDQTKMLLMLALRDIEEPTARTNTVGDETVR